MLVKNTKNERVCWIRENPSQLLAAIREQILHFLNGCPFTFVKMEESSFVPLSDRMTIEDAADRDSSTGKLTLWIELVVQSSPAPNGMPSLMGNSLVKLTESNYGQFSFSLIGINAQPGSSVSLGPQGVKEPTAVDQPKEKISDQSNSKQQTLNSMWPKAGIPKLTTENLLALHGVTPIKTVNGDYDNWANSMTVKLIEAKSYSHMKNFQIQELAKKLWTIRNLHSELELIGTCNCLHYV